MSNSETYKWEVTKPTLSIAKKLFKRRNPDITFSVSWEKKPVWINGGYVSTVRFSADKYKTIIMRLYSDSRKICIF
tara:strand:+ start:83 stop:310 length:228 start_codon:yes stop_codon:yes gene_type:complete